MDIDYNEEAPDQSAPDSRPKAQDNSNLHNYSTTPKSFVNIPPEDPNSAESRALRILKKAGYKNIQQLDWIAQDPDGQWTVIEIKDKELFEPGTNYPHWGAGLDKRQLYLRTQLFEDPGWSTTLIQFVKGTNTYYEADLQDLESSGDYYDTPSGIRIYRLDNYTKGEYQEE